MGVCAQVCVRFLLHSQAREPHGGGESVHPRAFQIILRAQQELSRRLEASGGKNDNLYAFLSPAA